MVQWVVFALIGNAAATEAAHVSVFLVGRDARVKPLRSVEMFRHVKDGKEFRATFVKGQSSSVPVGDYMMRLGAEDGCSVLESVTVIEPETTIIAECWGRITVRQREPRRPRAVEVRVQVPASTDAEPVFAHMSGLGAGGTRQVFLVGARGFVAYDLPAGLYATILWRAGEVLLSGIVELPALGCVEVSSHDQRVSSRPCADTPSIPPWP